MLKRVAGNQKAQKILLFSVAIVSFVILVSAAVVATFLNHRLEQREVIIGNARILVDVADTPAERHRGLSGTQGLKPDTGMLFIFDQLDNQEMWMKDMRYSLDMLWLDDDQRVVHIEERLPPSSYPATVESPTPARYVVEVPSGFVAAHHIQEGTIATFSR